MFKILLNLVLNIIVGGLKPVLLAHIESVHAEDITDEAKRKAVLDSFKDDMIKAGKTIGDSLLNLAIETGLQIFKSKLKG